STHHVSLALSYNPSLVSIKDAMVRPSPVFKSLYRTYEAQDFVDVILRNSAQDPLEVTVSIDIPTLTKIPYEETLTLPPQSTERYGFTLTFPQDLLSTQSSYYDHLVQPTVKVTYVQGRRSKTTSKRLSSLYVLGKGKISWSNARRIAAFVTPESRTVEQFARGLVARYADTLNRKFARNNLGKAALIFDGLSVYGLRYQQDQTTPYLQIFEDDSVFDSVKYPYEFLQAKIGDCDDCTVIYASMLENLNIPTVALDVNDPEYGHIYMMFDSGIDISDAGDFFTDEKEYVIWQGRLWIPVETTLFGQSFADAWRNGAKEYHIRKERGYINEILISEAQQTFRPGVVPDADIALPSTAALEELFNRDLAYFDNRLDQIAMASGVSFDDAEGLYDAGATYLRLGQFDRALDSFDKSLALDPTNADAYNGKGVILTRQRQYDQAIALFQKALELNPNDAGFRINIALTHHLQGRKGDAQRAYQEAVTANREFAGVLDFLSKTSSTVLKTAPAADPLQRLAAVKAYEDGAAFLRLKAEEKALDAFNRALSLDPNNADALNGKGVIATRQKNLDEALQLFRNALLQNPNNAGVHANQAIVYYLQGRKGDAVLAYQKAVQIDPEYRGQLDFITGGEPLPVTAGVGQAQPVNRLQKMAAEKAYDDGAAYLRLKAEDKALDAFNRALTLDPNNADALNGQGVIATRQKNLSEAVQLYQKAIQTDPNNASFHSNLAIAYHLQGRKDNAVLAYQKAVELDPAFKGQLDFISASKPTVPTRAAQPIAVSPLQKLTAQKSYAEGATYLRLKANEKALQAFDRALELDPGNADAYNGKGIVTTHQRNYENAIRLYTRAIELDPKNAGFHANLAIAYHLQGKKEAAQKAYQKAIELDPIYKGQLEALEK
ncbi:MAG: tetratricopeptide repeat protein, partial [bacterium]|nr:tetratricopeptide repeat protein [bacterium]